MRSSKSRSRSKSNRNRSVGNIVNRVFDSSGPEGKVRGTPQQIIDKYNQLARDAQLGNDRVAFENFQQHAEHYTRMLAEAQREQEARREHEQQNRDRQQTRPDDGQGQEGGRMNGHDVDDGRNDDRPQRQETQGGSQGGNRQEGSDQTEDVIDTGGEGNSTLVETPESRPPRPRRRRRAQAEKDEPEEPQSEQNGEQEAAE